MSIKKVSSETYESFGQGLGGQLSKSAKNVDPHFLNPSQRPEEIQVAISKAFKELSNPNLSPWHFNGNERYKMCRIDEHKLVEKMVEKAPSTQNDFYVLDIGAGNFSWGDCLASFLNKNEKISQNISFHMISLRGESDDQEDKNLESIKKCNDVFDRCKFYRFGGFKVEELSSEFEKRGLFLDKKVDLIVSRWCFRHLVDPVGTFVMTYDLLRPQTGLLLMDGFCFLSEDETWKDVTFIKANLAMARLLLDTKAPFLIANYEFDRSLNRFILKRPNDTSCQLPMRYKGMECSPEITNATIGSGCVTKFSCESKQNDKLEIQLPGVEGPLSGDKVLYDWLADNELLPFNFSGTQHLKWHPLIQDKFSNSLEESWVISLTKSH